MARKHLLAALSMQLSGALPRVQLLPAGTFTASDGRPGSLTGVTAKAWVLDAAAAAALVAKVNARATPLAIDYEHQTIHAETNGQPAPAAAWFSKIEFVDGVGLFAIDVQWTERAKTMIAAGEYKFISPVFTFNRTTGIVTGLAPAALTNNPALDGMQAVALAARFTDPEEETSMSPLLLALLKALGLAETVTEADAVAKVATLKAAADEVVALKAKKPDPAEYVAIAVHNEAVTKLNAATTELTTLKGAQVKTDVEALLAQGVKDAKLLGDAAVAWAREHFAADPAGLKKYIDAQPAIAALKGPQSDGKPPASGPGALPALNDTQKALCKRMGIPEADYQAQLQAEAAVAA